MSHQRMGGTRMRTLARRAAPALLAAALSPLLLASDAWANAGSDPAAGAPLGDVLLATGGAALLTIAMLAIGSAHRERRTLILDRAGAWAERQWGLPGW